VNDGGRLLDTNVLFDSGSARDDYHETARKRIRGIDHGTLLDLIVMNYILAETQNLAREKLGLDETDQMLDRLKHRA
jgi:predicted nucleic acid-binding protein